MFNILPENSIEPFGRLGKRRTTLNRARSILALLVSSLVIAAGMVSITPPHAAQAAVAVDFNPGLIISDSLFFDGGAMSASQVQEFLNVKVGACASGYTCLKSYRQDTPNKDAVVGRCGAYAGALAESAATIITKVGQMCGISQKALIVLLQKEQGLITSTAPSEWAYRAATGYGCPDTSVCDSLYYGFFNQVYMAALQFKRYAANPTGWNHVAGQVNQIRLHPNTACGSTAVYIENQATAGLYNYTPYKPNQAALANLYGTGDSCSSYGNRNFFRFYTDWFGSTQTTSLVRTIDNARVYLIAFGVKYPIPSMSVFAAFAPLGGVSYVSQRYLDSLTTGHSVGRTIRASSGAIYFVDSGIKLHFGSCDLLVDYGASCESDGYVNLTDGQIAAFVNGPRMTSILTSSTGPRYYMAGGEKHEVLDVASLRAAGITDTQNVLSPEAVEYLRLGAPVVRDGVFVQERSTSTYYFLTRGSKFTIRDLDAVAMGIASRKAGTLSAESISKIPGASSFSGLVVVAGSSSTQQVLSASGRYTIEGTSLSASAEVTTISADVLATYPDMGVLPVGSFVKSGTSATVYVVTQNDIRPVSSWDALMALSGGGNPNIISLSSVFIDAVPHGFTLLVTGTLYRTPENPMVYLINGISAKVPLANFDYPNSAGFVRFEYTTPERLDSYPTDSTSMTYGLTCGSTNYVSAAGAAHRIPTGSETLYPFDYISLDQFTCGVLPLGSEALPFIRTPGGAIFALVDGQKRHISTMERFAQLNPAQTWMSVSSLFAASVPTGPPA